MHPDQIKFYNPFSLLVVNRKGKLRQLFVPILVKCSHPCGTIQKDSMVYVEQVTANTQYRILYRVFDKWYPYYFFVIEP
jgi:hypothetical protein